MKKQTQTVKINRETLEELKNQSPNESFNDIVGWALFEMEYSKKNAKRLGIPLELYGEANRYIYHTSRIWNAEILDFTKIMKEKLEDANYEDATKALIEEYGE